MEKTENLGSRVSKTGRKQSWGKFLCLFCNKIVERMLGNGLRDKSCGCVQYRLVSESNKGRKCSEETKQKQSKIKKGKSTWNKGLTNEIDGRVQNNSEKRKGRKNTIEQREKISKEKHWNWQDGISLLPYSPEFNKEKKQQILERDNYTCQGLNCLGNHKKLAIHHIDYDKQNNNTENLVTLGVSCHIKTNHNRDYWLNYYQNIMINRIMECLL